MHNIFDKVEGNIVSICIDLFTIEIRYLHAPSQAEAGIVIKHSVVWAETQENWGDVRISDVQKKMIGQFLSGLSVYPGGARFLVGSNPVEVIQDGPTEYLEIWWNGDGLPARQYI
ncbi:hypothetical protein EI983_10100 [Roseovarius faecimaris]|uniref:Uncharacterized protein n=1 Tax=Roseovarius faecimaris TaxID=2494550 RepID=A0A6I6INI4_9RHOB|nr:hypothetical protein [Roseovarius faecimaris]QGX98609.1 hypothetical protein EI983_10100 [Roseovarius faecimaris]